jgi:hypothetical protein
MPVKLPRRFCALTLTSHETGTHRHSEMCYCSAHRLTLKMKALRSFGTSCTALLTERHIPEDLHHHCYFSGPVCHVLPSPDSEFHISTSVSPKSSTFQDL